MTNVQEVKIESLSQYVSEIEKLRKEIDEEKENCLHKEMLYRGQANKNYTLLPKIARNRNSAVSNTIFNQERNLIELAKYKMPDVFLSTYAPVELLAKLQHYGISTRLLDITENPLVALYFACKSNAEEIDKDGEVVVFKPTDIDIALYPLENAIAESYKFAKATFTPLEKFFTDIIEQPYFTEQYVSMHQITPQEGASWIYRCCTEVFFLHAPNFSKRQAVQRGRYILFNNEIVQDKNSEDIRFETIIKELPKDHECVMRRIIIPADKKNEILNSLYFFGIDGTTLFPDNVDIACSEIDQTFRNR